MIAATNEARKLRLGFDKVAGVGLQCRRQFSKDSHAGRHARAFDRADIAQAETCEPGYIFLRQVPLVTKSSEIFRQNVLQIHAQGIME